MYRKGAFNALICIMQGLNCIANSGLLYSLATASYFFRRTMRNGFQYGVYDKRLKIALVTASLSLRFWEMVSPHLV